MLILYFRIFIDILPWRLKRIRSISSLHILLRDDMQFKPPPLVPISPVFNWLVLPSYSKSGGDEVNIFLDTRPFIFKLL